MAKKTPKTRKPKEINLLNIIILVAAVCPVTLTGMATQIWW